MNFQIQGDHEIILRRSIVGMFKQGRPAYDEHRKTGPMYHAPDARRCAIGLLIDGMIPAHFEGRRVGVLMDHGYITVDDGSDVRVLSDLQRVHDWWSEWHARAYVPTDDDSRAMLARELRTLAEYRRHLYGNIVDAIVDEIWGAT